MWVKLGGGAACVLMVGLVLGMGVDLVIRGLPGFHGGYLWQAPTDLGRSGGIGPLLVSTFILVSLAVILAALVSLPAAAIYTEKLGPKGFHRTVRLLLDVGLGLPRIVWGLFGSIFFGGLMGFGFSLITGILTLACLLAPILATGFIAGIEAVDPALRQQCRALGVSGWVALWTQVIPAARPAFIAAIALAAGRGCGDAAALLFTAGLATSLPQSFFDSAATLAVFIFTLLSTVPGGQPAAYSAAAVLFGITLFIQLIIARNGETERIPS